MKIAFAFNLSSAWEIFIKNKRFGIISAYKNELSKKKNEERAEYLKDYVRKVGYGYKEIYGVWKGIGGVTIEYPLFIPNLTKEDALFLGRDECLPEKDRHPQESVVVGDGNYILLIDVSSGSIDKKWSQMEVGWEEFWTGYSKYKGKEWRYSNKPKEAVIWGMIEEPIPQSWGGALRREAYFSPDSTFIFDKKRIEDRYSKISEINLILKHYGRIIKEG